MARSHLLCWTGLLSALCLGAALPARAAAPAAPPVPTAGPAVSPSAGAAVPALPMDSGRPTAVPGEIMLEFHGLKGCPDEALVRERTADLFDFVDPFVPQGQSARSTIVVTLRHTRSHYRVELDLFGADGIPRSTFEEHTSCDALVWQIAHRLRLMIVRPRPPPPPPPRSDELKATVEELARRLDRVEEKAEAQDEQTRALEKRIAALNKALEELRKTKMNLTYTLSTGLLMTANLTSNVGPGVWVGGDLRIDPLSFGLELRAVLPARVEVGAYDNDLSQFVGLLTPCGRYSVFFGCAVAGAGVQVDHDAEVPPPTTYNPLVQLGGRLGVEVPLGESRFALRGWAEVLYSTPHSDFTYAHDGVLLARADRPDVSAFFGLGLVVRLGEPGAN